MLLEIKELLAMYRTSIAKHREAMKKGGRDPIYVWALNGHSDNSCVTLVEVTSLTI